MISYPMQADQVNARALLKFQLRIHKNARSELASHRNHMLMIFRTRCDRGTDFSCAPKLNLVRALVEIGMDRSAPETGHSGVAADLQSSFDNILAHAATTKALKAIVEA